MSHDTVEDILKNAKKPEEVINEAIERLAKLSPLEYDQIRKEEADKLNVRVSTLDDEIEKKLPHQMAEDESENFIQDVEPWHEEVNGQELFDALVQVFNRYLALQKHQPETMALWAIFSYCLDANNIAPKLLVYSPEKRCGKTTLLDVLIGLVWKAIPASNITPAAIFRTIEGIGGTIVIDEADTFINENPEINGIINSGHRKSSAYVIRLVGDKHEPKQFSTWSPNIIAMIGKPKDTIVDRSIMIEMRRKKSDEKIGRFIPHKAEAELQTLARKIRRWSNDNFDSLKNSDPEILTNLNDRATDNWRPLFAISDLIGEECSQLSRNAALTLSQEDDNEDDSVGMALLNDIRGIFQEEAMRDRISTEDLLEKLYDLEGRPWLEWNRVKPLSAHQIAKHLKPFRIASKTIRLNDITKKGYETKQFEEAFSRYLPDLSVTPSQLNDSNEYSEKAIRNTEQNVTHENTIKPVENIDCDAVTDDKGEIPW